MSARNREASAAEVVLRVLDAQHELPASGLVALDGTRTVAATLDARGCAPREWQRFADGPGVDALPWPAPAAAPAELATLRIPKGRDALRMSLHAVASQLAAGAPIFVYGANDEGIRSSGGLLEALFDDVKTVEARRHCRVWRAVQREGGVSDAALDDWLSAVAFDTPVGPATLWSAPGLFAHERLDAGTRLLLESLPDLEPAARVLDFGCGAGAISWAVAHRQPRSWLWMLDRDALATHVAARNVPGASVLLGNGFAAAGDLRFDWILSNPPLHEGKASAPALLVDLIQGAPSRLRKGGALRLVTHRSGPAGRLLADTFEQASVLRETRSYRVWHASRPRR